MFGLSLSISQIVKNHYPLPRINDLFDQMKGAQVFSKIDINIGYHQLCIQEANIHQTTFHTLYGHYWLTVVPFRLTNVPLVFTSLMYVVFFTHPNHCVIVFLYDISIYLKNLEEYEVHFHLVLQCLRDHKLYGNLSKCGFFQLEVKYLGHIIIGDRIIVDPKKIYAIMD